LRPQALIIERRDKKIGRRLRRRSGAVQSYGRLVLLKPRSFAGTS
jgi:hypothetical protein